MKLGGKKGKSDLMNVMGSEVDVVEPEPEPETEPEQTLVAVSAEVLEKVDQER